MLHQDFGRIMATAANEIVNRAWLGINTERLPSSAEAAKD